MEKRQSVIRIMVLFLCVALFPLGIGIFQFRQVAADDVSMEPKGFEFLEALVENTSTYETTESKKINGDYDTYIVTHYVTDIRFEYEGETISKSIEGNPFAKKGEIIGIYYNPRTHEIRHDFVAFETFLSKIFYIPSIVMMMIGAAIVLLTLRIGFKKLRLYRDENLITGVVSNVSEILLGDGKSRTTVYCTFTSPDSGMPVTISKTSVVPVSLYEGQNVEIFYNKKNPAKSVMDL